MKLGRGWWGELPSVRAKAWNAGAIEFFDPSILRNPSNQSDALIVPAQDRGQILNSRDTVNIARWQVHAGHGGSRPARIASPH
jgi:hypothetical protein